MTKNACSEIKNMNNPPAGVDKVVIAIADFVDGRSGANTWVSAKGRLFELLRQGVGVKDQVSSDQLSILRAYVKTGIKTETITKKSVAAGQLLTYLNAMLAL